MHTTVVPDDPIVGPLVDEVLRKLPADQDTDRVDDV